MSFLIRSLKTAKNPGGGEATYQVRRKHDGKLFRLARFTAPGGDLFNHVFLEEW